MIFRAIWPKEEPQYRFIKRTTLSGAVFYETQKWTRPIWDTKIASITCDYKKGLAYYEKISSGAFDLIEVLKP